MEVNKDCLADTVIPETQDDDFLVFKIGSHKNQTKPNLRAKTTKLKKSSEPNTKPAKPILIKKRKVPVSPNQNCTKQTKQVKQLCISSFFTNAKQEANVNSINKLKPLNLAREMPSTLVEANNCIYSNANKSICRKLELGNVDSALNISSIPERTDIITEVNHNLKTKMISSMNDIAQANSICESSNYSNINKLSTVNTVSKSDSRSVTLDVSFSPEAVDLTDEPNFSSETIAPLVVCDISQGHFVRGACVDLSTNESSGYAGLKSNDVVSVFDVSQIPETQNIVEQLNFNPKTFISPIVHNTTEDSSNECVNTSSIIGRNFKLKDKGCISVVTSVPELNDVIGELDFKSKVSISPVKHDVTDNEAIAFCNSIKMNTDNLHMANRKLNDIETESVASLIPGTIDLTYDPNSKSTMPISPILPGTVECQSTDISTNVIELAPKKSCPDQVFSDDMDWEEFGGNLTFSSQEIRQKFSPPKGVNGSDSNVWSDSRNQKFRVNKIHHSRPNEIELLLEDVAKLSTTPQKCILRGFWTESVLNVGDMVSILSPFVDGIAVIDDCSGFLVINPDLLVSSTSVVSTLFCMRKAVLSQRYRQWEPTNRIMMIGVLVHQLFQQAVNECKYLEKDIKDILTRIMKYSENLILMCSQGQSEEEVYIDLMSYVSSISQWIKKHCVTEKSPHQHKDLLVTEVRDIEDNIWCTKYGLKGKIDLTVQVEVQNQTYGKMMPLELKTGIPSFSSEHIGQVNLYTLMMEDRNHERSDGLLLYLKGGPQMKQVPSDHNIQRGLIQLRNELAHFCFNWKALKTDEEKFDENLSGNCYLPDPISNKRLCQRCNFILPCTLYQKAYATKELNTSHPMSTLVPNNTSHVVESHLQYFRRWSYLLSLESASASIETCFWNEDPCKCEKEGMCFSYMVLQDDISTQQEKEGDLYVHSFFRSPKSPIKTDFCGIKPGDSVAISNQENNLQVALATGFVISVTADCVQVSIERDIQKLARYDNYLYRLDKLLYNSAINTSYKNLMKLMMTDTRSTHLRQSIIDKKAPEFLLTMSKSIAVKARPYLKDLNKPQRKAVFKVLMAKDYALLKGMPGTGKTATIVALVRQLVQMGHSVLLTSHTHSAVDNILRKLLQFECHFVRIGQTSRIHADILPYSFQCLTKSMNSVQQLSNFIHSNMVFASTCLGINHVVFETRKFDYCVVDEASQVVQTICLGPLFYADKFVLVGDPNQLPPVVINELAKKNGMQESLFTRLGTSSNCFKLSLQYRMNQEIMRVCNEFAYDNTMQCGSPEVASSVLNVDTVKLNSLCASDKEWLLTALDSQLKNSLMFLNTDDIPALESRDNQGHVKNDIEVQLVCSLSSCLIKCGVFDIGVITPYRCQVDLVTRSLAKMGISGIEVNTVDQYQGKDKEAIIISCVRSGHSITEDKSASVIVGDERRLNVAISRAKRKLLIVGSKSTLAALDCFQRLFTILRPAQILQLPKNCQNTFDNLIV